MATIIRDGECCEDCALYIANGDHPRGRDIVADIVRHLGTARGLVLDWGEDDSEPWFSWRQCECCGDTDGGNRLRFVQFDA